MKKFEITKEQILQLNSYNNYDCGVALKEWFPQAFQSELETGKWYKSQYGCLKFFIDEKTTYGFDSTGRWVNTEDGFNIYSRFQNWKPATDKEVETALIAEANRRWVWEQPINDTENKIQKHKIFASCFDESDNLLWSSYGRVFHNGVWAKPIETPIEVTLEQIAEKFNVNVEQLKIKK